MNGRFVITEKALHAQLCRALKTESLSGAEVSTEALNRVQRKIILPQYPPSRTIFFNTVCLTGTFVPSPPPRREQILEHLNLVAARLSCRKQRDGLRWVVSRAKRVAAESGSLVHRVASRLDGVLYFFKVGRASCVFLYISLLPFVHVFGVVGGKYIRVGG